MEPISEEDFDYWLKLRTSQEFFRVIKARIVSRVESLSTGGTLVNSGEEIKNTAKLVGEIESLRELLEIEILKEDMCNESK